MVRLRLSVLGLVCIAGLTAGCSTDSCDRRPFWERWFSHNGNGKGCCESAAPGCCDPMMGGDMGPMMPPMNGTLSQPTIVPPGTPPPIRPVPNQPMSPPMTGAPMSQPQAYAPPLR
jgi:hypothetical protein